MSSAEKTARSDSFASWRDLYRFSTRIPLAAAGHFKVGWPVFAWRAVVPRLLDRNTDPFQRAILRFVQAGVVSDREVGRYLGLNPLLVRQVQQGCVQSNLLDRQMRLTPLGIAVIREEEPEDLGGNVVDMGWIFRCALSGDVLPMFFRGSLPPAPRAARAEVSLLRPTDEFCIKPTRPSVVAALKSYQRIARFEPDDEDRTGLLSDLFDPGDFEPVEWDTDDEADHESQQSSLSPKLVRLPTLQPERIWIETRLYRTDDDPLGWAVASPFGMAGGWWFKRKLDWAIGRQPSLADTLRSFTDPPPLSATVVKDLVAGPRARALHVYPVLGRDPRLSRVLETVRLSFAAEEQYHVNPENLDLVLTRYQKCLEALLNACIDTIPSPERERVVTKVVQPTDCFYLFRDVATTLQVDLPWAFKQYRQPWKLDKVAQLRGTAVRDRTAFLLAHAAIEPASRCRPMLKDHPQLLSDLDLVADLRNKQGAHYNEGVASSGDDVFENVHQAFSRSVETLTSYFFEEKVDGRQE